MVFIMRKSLVVGAKKAPSGLKVLSFVQPDAVVG